MKRSDKIDKIDLNIEEAQYKTQAIKKMKKKKLEKDSIDDEIDSLDFPSKKKLSLPEASL